MDRRSVLTAGVAVSVAAVAGCASVLDDGSEESPQSETRPADDPGGVHHLFVENHTETTRAARLQVVREDETTLVDGRYELPDGRGIKFANVAAWETTYTISVSLEGEDVTALEWQTPECTGTESPDGGGSRNAGVRIGANDAGLVSIRVDQCDAVWAETLPSGPADGFRLGP